MLVLACFMISLLVLSFLVCTAVGVYLCKDTCCNRENERIIQRYANLEAAEGFGTRGIFSPGPSLDSTPGSTDFLQPLKTARALLPNCKIVKYSTKKLPSQFGRSSKWKNETCAICLDMYDHAEYIAICPCKHGYHLACLVEWLKVKSDCPLCKRRVKNELSERTPLLFPSI